MAGETEATTRKETKAALCYIPFLGWIVAAIFLFVEKDTTIRWHAAQSLLMHAIVAAIYWVAIPLLKLTLVLTPVAWLLQGVTGVGFFILCLVMIVKVNQGEKLHLPLLSEWTDKVV